MQDEPRGLSAVAALLRHRRPSWWLSNVIMFLVLIAVFVRPDGISRPMLGLVCVGATVFSGLLWSRSER